ncbi:LicD family protein [Lactococcus lactis]|uniref:LicD family protein n=1 Tax=Lactococcus lactis TaxID=1358 RepID=UPI001783765D|nr:LicD family protein [Lactococcus lactis]MBD5854209.1 phosphorylcholine transferase LicD [Lactococcus lactis]
MKQVSEKEQREIQLQLVKFIDEICRTNDIEYSLAGGSLLGAIRHGGYIPWDDDIDLMLTRPNYNKLMTLLLEKQTNDMDLKYYKADPIYLPFAKLCDTHTIGASKTDLYSKNFGVNIDIFPIDVLPGDKKVRENFKKMINKKSFQLLASNPTGLEYASASRPLYFIGKLILWLPYHIQKSGKYKKVALEMETLMQKYNESENKYKGYVCSFYPNEYVPTEVFDDYEEIKFEEFNFKKIKDHNAYLSQLYGDYMKLPPENKRVNHGYTKFYWK